MRRRYVLLIAAIGLALFIYLIGKVSWREAMLTVSSANPWHVFFYIAASVVIRILLALRWQVILKAKNITVPLKHILGFRTGAFAVSFITPGPRVGGEAVAAGLVSRYREKNKKIPFSKALSTLVVDRAVEAQTFATLFFIGVLWLALVGDISGTVRAILLATSILLLSLIILMSINVSRGKIFISTLVKKITKNKSVISGLKEFEKTIVSFYREDKKEFIQSHIISSLAWLISLVEYYFLLKILGVVPSLAIVFIIYSFVGFAYLIPVPLAIGSLEGSQALAFTILGMSTGIGLVLALITRLRDIIFTIIGFMVLLYYGIVPTKAKSTIR